MKKKKKNFFKFSKKILKKTLSVKTVLIIIAILLIVWAFILPAMTKKEGKQNIVTTSSLEKVVKSSTLSTYETVYNGIVPVINDKESKEVDYYISYEATIEAGLDFDKLKITKDDKAKKFYVNMPEITLLSPVVKEDLDYIIINKKVDENGLFAEAYKKAKADVTSESTKQTALLTYATKNAENLIRGLLTPFVEQADGYTIEFKYGGNK